MFSDKYDDIYFNAENPEAEKQFVFVDANRIGDRMATLNPQAQDFFTVAELGFGFGINYALTLVAARKAGYPSRLRYFSVEEDLPRVETALAFAPRLETCRPEFTELWNSIASRTRAAVRTGTMQNLGGSRVYAGGVGAYLSHLAAAVGYPPMRIDAWYFDGFSPAKNPAMWSAEVFKSCYELTRPGGTFSTYSAAGAVRRNLAAAGYCVKKTRGYGTKREMLVGFRPETI